MTVLINRRIVIESRSQLRWKKMVHPWASTAMFCSGFFVGYCLCFVAISHFRGIPRARWLHCLPAPCWDPTAHPDPASALTGTSDSSAGPSRRLFCRVAADQKAPYSRRIPCCSGIMLLGSSDPNTSRAPTPLAEQEKLRPKTMAAISEFNRRYYRFRRADGDTNVVLENPRQSVFRFWKHPVLLLDWGPRMCGGRGHTLSRHVAARLVEALREDPSVEFVQVSCCPETESH